MAQTSRRRTDEQWLSDLSAYGHRAADAQSDLLDALRHGLHRALRSRGIDEASIDDFAQEAAVRVLGALSTYQGQSRFTTWAIAIAVRVAFTHMRARRWKRITLGDLDQAHDLRTIDFSGVQQNPCGDPELRAQIFTIMQHIIERELPDRQRRLLLAEMADMPMQQLADEFGLTRNAVYKAGHDARKRLRAALERRGITDDQVRDAFGLRTRSNAPEGRRR